MKNGLKYVSPLHESVSFIWERRVLSEKDSCFVWAVGVWSGGLLFSCTERGKPLKHSHPRREFDQLLLLGHARPPSAQEEARCNRSFCWTRSFVIETCTSWNWNFILFLNFYLFFKLKNGFFWLCWVCISMHKLSLVTVSGAYSSRCMGFLLGWLLLLQSMSSRTQAQ